MFRDVGDSNYRIRKLWLLLLICLATTILPACASGQTQVATSTPILPIPSPTTPLPKDWQSRWLKGIPCRPPCWEGITPGHTNTSEAEEILRHSPLIGAVKSWSYNPNFGVVSWDWLGGQQGGGAEYPARTSTQVIFAISPIFYTTYSLREIMEVYGNPSHIIAEAKIAPDMPKIFYSFWVVYLSQGIALRGGGPDKPELDAHTLFYSVGFFVPTQEGLEQSVRFAKEHPDWVIPWEGFKGFDYYCRDELNGRVCRGK